MDHPVLPVLDFALTSFTNIFMPVVFHYFCLLVAQFCDKIVQVRNPESHM